MQGEVPTQEASVSPAWHSPGYLTRMSYFLEGKGFRECILSIKLLDIQDPVQKTVVFFSNLAAEGGLHFLGCSAIISSGRFA